MGYIYLRTNLINGKKYVGQTKDIKVRNRNWNNLKKEYGGHAIENARKKYGADGFSFEILKECGDEEMNYWEMYYIKEYNSKTPYGYNSTDGGDSVCEMTDEIKKKIADTLRGRKLSEETKAKISAALRGKPKPKVAAAKRGKKRSEETKLKIAAKLRGKPKSPEHVTKMALAQGKAVQALDKEGNVIYEFASTQEAGRQGFNQRHVSECCRNCYSTHKGNIYKGYIWRYAV